MKRVAVVTGGTRGIGAAIAKALHEQGHTVIAVYKTNAHAAEEFHKKTGIHTYCFDVSCFESCKKNIEKIKETHGNIEILINNAGITRDAMLHKMTPSQWSDVITANLTSCFNMSRLVIESMREKGYGRIINISSINGQKGQAGQCNYAAAKAGLIGFSRALAQESGSKGITVNVIAPGYIETDMSSATPSHILDEITQKTPMKRLGTPYEIGQAVVYLASEHASFITGSTLSINGGLHFS